MTPHDSMSIGAFAQHTGLTTSALRFYGDVGILPPAWVDQHSGYRYYDEAQLHPAQLIREMRELDMPLAKIRRVLAADAQEAAKLIDAHVSSLADSMAEVRHRASALRAALGSGPIRATFSVPGPLLADAIDQVFSATIGETGPSILSGVHLAISEAGVSLTATDRYRLARRTLVPISQSAPSWVGTLEGRQLRHIGHEIREHLEVTVDIGDTEAVFRSSTLEQSLACRILDDDYPDIQVMLDALGEVTCRIIVARHQLLSALEHISHQFVVLRVADGELTVAVDGGQDGEQRIPIVLTGPATMRSFETVRLYPAISTAIGPDVVIDLREEGQPVTIRSADRGDLTTVLMPVNSTP